MLNGQPDQIHKDINLQPLRAKLFEERLPDRVTRKLKFGGKEIWWDISGPESALPPKLGRHDMAATALAFYAMNNGVSLHIDGPVSLSLLEKLEDFVACWSLWRPDLYKKIDISSAEEVKQDQPANEAIGKAVAAFSGGLDASFTIWRHKNNLAGRRTKYPIAGVLIQGLDIPLSNHAAFEQASVSAQETMQSIDMPLVILRSNIKDDISVDWEMEFGIIVATCMRNWAGQVDTALIGSDEDYKRLVFPWGGNPITYSMLSSRDFGIVYDGGEFARTEKAHGLAGWDTGLKNLRVCWEGPITGQNCGTCEKCIRTKLNFMAFGHRLPPSLPKEPSFTQIFSVRARNNAQLALLGEIAQIAEAQGINKPWLGALRACIKKNKVMNQAKAIESLRHTFTSIKLRNSSR